MSDLECPWSRVCSSYWKRERELEREGERESERERERERERARERVKGVWRGGEVEGA